MRHTLIRRSTLLLLFLATALGVSAQKAPKSKLESNLRAHVAYLASDGLEGRRTGEKGATVAAGYISNMFADFKLVPGYKNGNGKGYFQPFEFVSGVELGKVNSFGVGGSPVQLKEDWMPVGFSPDTAIDDAGIVFAGFGITAKDLKYDDYAGLNASGKLVIVLAGTPDSGNPHSGFGRFGLHAKAIIAKQNGAKALVMVSNNKDFADEKLSLRFDQTLGETAVPVIVISQQAAERLLRTADLKQLATAAAAKGGHGTQASEIVDTDLGRASLTVSLKKIKAAAYNVVGIIPGTDRILKNEAIVIGAHYDHLGRGGEGSLRPDSNEIHHGADDNASGTASLMELARKFKKAGGNRRTLVFVAFGGEEEGLIGSKAYVNHPVFPIENTIAMINMDMVGRLNKRKLTVGGIGTAGLWKELVEGLNSGKLASGRSLKGYLPKPAIPAGTDSTVVNASVVKTSLFDLKLSQDGFGPSDHSSFYGKKVPVLFFFTGTHSDYHKPSDTAEKINYEGLAKINAFVAEIVNVLDRRKTRPQYKVAKASGMQGARTGFNVSLGTIPSYSDSENDGLVLDGVRKGSPADKAGLKGGDKIVSLAGREIRNISDYMFALSEMKAGKEYAVVAVREGKRVELKIVPDARK